ncbi:unannotated protein [freshwater metagenome]|uniref:Unannotated protein n=1 Tax=freshwater metagenome TaxID=449393 RepID=A0A6J7A654_9ZZZZ
MHGVTRHGIESSEGFIHEEHICVLSKGAGEGNPLAHPSAQFVRTLVREVAEMHQVEQFTHPLLPGGARHLAQLQRERNVGRHGEPREQR